MRMLRLIVTMALVCTASVAQDHDPSRMSHSYADLKNREIKALSASQIEDLQAGRGMGMSLPAELNSVPGPMHALQLGKELGLSADQRHKLELVMRAMRADAIELGTRVIAAERQLEAAFAGGSAKAAFVDAQAERIGTLNGKLRAVHLKAHLRAAAILTPAQIDRYEQLRGYREAK